MTKSYGHACFLVSEQADLSFVFHLFNKRLAHASVYKILSGVSFFLKLLGERSILDFFVVKQILKGYKRIIVFQMVVVLFLLICSCGFVLRLINVAFQISRLCFFCSLFRSYSLHL